MEFIETSVVVASARGLLTETDLIDLQSVLMLRPEAGAVTPGTGGCRKLRWALPGRGKSGGARVIYYGSVPIIRFTCSWPTRRNGRTT